MDLKINKATLSRLPSYLRYLNGIKDNTKNVSSPMIAKSLGYGEVLVRKDLNSVCGAGKPKTGYLVSELIESIEKLLNTKKHISCILIGAGKLGRALLDYDGFKEYGMDIVSGFDICPNPELKIVKPVYPMSELKEYLATNDIKVAIITTPAKSARAVSEELIENGIKLIWNFTPVKLKSTSDVIIENENLALSLAYLFTKDHLFKEEI